MARHESDREDLLREATALVRRIELRLPDLTEAIVVGFRRDGAASFFFGFDPVFQFRATGELRRAFRDGLLIKADSGRLVALRRSRTEHESLLLSRELPPDETQALLDDLCDRLNHLHRALVAAEYEIVGQAPHDEPLVEAVLAEVQRLLGRPIVIADTPRVQS
ncbi:MAG: hypothetical protein KDA47_14665 [Planctomycetales bacterium]|nr:hypothetical protein [Planctomycetales bacterium]